MSAFDWWLFLLQVSYVLQDWWLSSWWVIPGLTQSAIKSTGSLISQSPGKRQGLFSLLFWSSCSFPEEKFLLVECDPPMVSPHVWPSAASHNFENRKSWFKLNFFFFLFRAALQAYGSSQAMGWIWVTAAGLYHSHSNDRCEPCLWPTPQLMAMPDP